MNLYVRPLSPHLEYVLRRGLGSLPEEAKDGERADVALLEAFPLDRARVSSEILEYVREPDVAAQFVPPHEAYLGYRLLLCRHMRLAFEEDAHWLVEMLERERELVAAQAAYALALEGEAGLRPAE